jgi:hypothetical protein
MSGFYNSLRFDSAYQDFQVYRDQSENDYVLNLNAHYRQGEKPIMPLSIAGQPTFWGPLRGSLVTQESFLQGRGQTLANCPDCDVVYLPETLFPANTAHNQLPRCQATDLEPLQSRMKKSCNGLDETDTSMFWMMPSNFQVGYSGPSLAGMQSRVPPISGQITQGSESYGTCSGSYGVYGNSRSFAPYSD